MKMSPPLVSLKSSPPNVQRLKLGRRLNLILLVICKATIFFTANSQIIRIIALVELTHCAEILNSHKQKHFIKIFWNKSLGYLINSTIYLLYITYLQMILYMQTLFPFEC